MFDRLKKLLNKSEFQTLSNLNILLIGIGGVGGYALESLVRLGIKNITIVDGDIIDLTNLNRQIISSSLNIGKKKVDEAKLRYETINPNIKLKIIDKKLNDENKNILDNNYDFIIDCCDDVNAKLLIYDFYDKHNVNLISSLGTANKFDASKLYLTTLDKTSYDPLAKKLRKKIKELNIKKKIHVVCSSEVPVQIKDSTLGSTSFVPASAGLLITSYIFNYYIKKCNL